MFASGVWLYSFSGAEANVKANQCLAGVFKVISQLFETRIVRILEILRLSHRQKLKLSCGNAYETISNYIFQEVLKISFWLIIWFLYNNLSCFKAISAEEYAKLTNAGTSPACTCFFNLNLKLWSCVCELDLCSQKSKYLPNSCQPMWQLRSCFLQVSNVEQM